MKSKSFIGRIDFDFKITPPCDDRTVDCTGRTGLPVASLDFLKSDFEALFFLVLHDAML